MYTDKAKEISKTSKLHKIQKNYRVLKRPKHESLAPSPAATQSNPIEPRNLSKPGKTRGHIDDPFIEVWKYVICPELCLVHFQFINRILQSERVVGTGREERTLSGCSRTGNFGA